MSKFTRNIEKDKELFKLPITTEKLAGIFAMFPEYVNRIRELEKENAVLKAEPCDELMWCGTTKDGRDMYCLKVRKGNADAE